MTPANADISPHGHTRALGKLPPRNDPRNLKLAKYVSALPPPPTSVAWSSPVAHWPMYKNDALGDCTCAAVGHMIQAWTASAKTREVDLSDLAIVNAYKAVGGYVPGDSSTDNGANELDVLNYWRKHGIGGHKIGAHVEVDPHDEESVRQAIFLFGGVYAGVALPASAKRQAVWDLPKGGIHGDGAPGSWGGHAIPILDYDQSGLVCVTWGALLRMTWRFFHAYVDEVHATISTDWLNGDGKAPSGFDRVELVKDLSAF